MLETVLYAPLRAPTPPKISSVIIAAGVTRNLAHQQQPRCHQLVGLDPISWTPYDVHGRCSGCQGQEGRTRRSFGGGS